MVGVSASVYPSIVVVFVVVEAVAGTMGKVVEGEGPAGVSEVSVVEVI